MYRRSGRIGRMALLAALMLAAPGLAWALGLGQIQSDTHIGQSLRARIPILAADPDALQGLSVGLADPAAYQRAGLREPDFLFDLKFTVERGATGSYVLVTSTQPVRLPFLNLLIRARWPSGEVVRQYTLLLNPPVFAAGTSGAKEGAPVEPARQAGVPQRNSKPMRRKPMRRVTPKPAAPPAVANAQPRSDYGPVARGETLWSIAARLRPDSGVGMNQMMIALYHANPQAFSGNINRLKAGAVLRVPTRSDLESISRARAGAEVASQNRHWQARTARRAEAETAAAKTQPKPEPQSGAGADVAASSPPAAAAGEVVLTAPRVSATTARAGAVGNGIGEAADAGANKGAAERLQQTTERTPPASKKVVPAARLAAASAGGPAKIHNAELAGLAAAHKTAEPPAHKTAKPGVTPAHTQPPAPVIRTPAPEQESILQDWLTTPKGWIAIAVIVLLIALLLFLFERRRRANRLVAAEPNPAAAATEAIEDDVAAAASVFEPAAADTMAEETGDGGAEMPPGHALPESAEPVEAAAGEAELANALVQADFYAGHGDHAGAARALALALEREPERSDLRLRRLEALFAAGDGEAFRNEAEELHRRIPPESADWQAAAGMGRQLFPGDTLFLDPSASADETLAIESAADDLDPLDFDDELDRLTGTQATATLQDDFERTLGELSTMIETYMPEDEVLPRELQTPAGEASGSSPEPVAAEEDEALDFVLDEPREVGDADAGGGDADDRTRFDLAQAYLDMGDRESARDVLEELAKDGEAAQREEAERLLAGLSESASDLSLESEGGIENGATPDADAEALVTAEEPAGEESESGTAIDLARAYLEMGDRESARDILEEVLDGTDEVQRESARSLLETLDA